MILRNLSHVSFFFFCPHRVSLCSLSSVDHAGMTPYLALSCAQLLRFLLPLPSFSYPPQSENLGYSLGTSWTWAFSMSAFQVYITGDCYFWKLELWEFLAWVPYQMYGMKIPFSPSLVTFFSLWYVYLIGVYTFGIVCMDYVFFISVQYKVSFENVVFQFLVNRYLVVIAQCV